MTLDRIRIVLASLAALLGVAHIIFGIAVFKSLTLEAFWFLSFGPAIIICALGNFKTDKLWVLRFQNAVILVFFALLLSLVQQPQIWFGTFLFSALLILSFAAKPNGSKDR